MLLAECYQDVGFNHVYSFICWLFLCLFILFKLLILGCPFCTWLGLGVPGWLGFFHPPLLIALAIVLPRSSSQDA